MSERFRPHAFVIMPFGKKVDREGTLFDFNAIYSQLVRPAVEGLSFQAFRIDEATNSSDLLTDMFQELLLADLCIADISLDHANVFYELGLRHSLRRRGIIHIQAGQGSTQFDLFNLRLVPYHITRQGAPDPAFLEKDRAAMSRVIRDTWASDQENTHSPIYSLLDGLAEPDRRMLRTPLASGYWAEYNQWKQQVSVAQRQNRVGDILLLTEEIENPLIREQAIGEAGQVLRSMDQHELALGQIRKGLEINPHNLVFRREEAFSLSRLGRADEAIVLIDKLLVDHPNDGETVAYLGRIYQEMWYGSWRSIPDRENRLKAAFSSYHWLIKAFDTYMRAYRYDLNNPYPGMSALLLGRILVYLADMYEGSESPDPEIQYIRSILHELEGMLVLALELQAGRDQVDFWTLISLAELRVLTSDSPSAVVGAYRKALTASRQNQFHLQSALGQLKMLDLLGLRPEFVQKGMEELEGELAKIQRELSPQQPARAKKTGQASSNKLQAQTDRKVFLFTGYSSRYFDEGVHNFSREGEDALRRAILAVLDRHAAGPDDLAMTTGLTAGSELIFVECCVERGMAVQAYFASPYNSIIQDFLVTWGPDWLNRFSRMSSHPRVEEYYQPDCVGLPRAGDNVHERNNRWALYSALAYGADNVRLIAVWDGKSDTSPDQDVHLVGHMVQLMRAAGGRIEQIHPQKLSQYFAGK